MTWKLVADIAIIKGLRDKKFISQDIMMRSSPLSASVTRVQICPEVFQYAN